MELVYLWVEKYKNIKNQGFNFSPRFECEFDENTKELTINENNDYVSIFPKNINITAIVGENGSGKSSVLNLLNSGTSPTSNYFYIFDLGKELIIKGINITKQPNKIITNYKIHKKIFQENPLIKLQCDSLDRGLLRLNDAYKISFIYYNNIYGDIDSSDLNTFLIGQVQKNNIDLSSLLYKYQFEYSNKVNSANIFSKFHSRPYNLYKNKTIQNTIKMLKDEAIILPIPKPDKIQIWMNFTNVKESNIELKYNFLESIDFVNFFFIEKTKYMIIFNFLIFMHSFPETYKLLEKVTKKDNINDIFQEFCDVFSIPHKLENCDEEKLFGKFKYANEFIDFLTSIVDKDEYLVIDIKIDDNCEKLIKLYHNIISGDNLEFLDFRWIPYLSSGQENLLFQFGNFYKLKQTIYLKDKLKDNLFIFIDEGENTLHPNWQKKYLKYLMDFFNKNFTQKINLIFTTHSPFLLSDLPKENVIFLEKDKQSGLCKNATKDIDIKTFGANIHTLLSHGFFMSDGLMGEFAKSKINEIKKFYEIVKFLEPKNKKYKRILKILYLFKIKKFKHIQSIIGEPFLQTIIKNYLDELEILFNGKKEFLDREIKRLQALQESLND